MVLGVIRVPLGGWLLRVGWLLFCGVLRGGGGGGWILLFETSMKSWTDFEDCWMLGSYMTLSLDVRGMHWVYGSIGISIGIAS